MTNIFVILALGLRSYYYGEGGKARIHALRKNKLEAWVVRLHGR